MSDTTPATTVATIETTTSALRKSPRPELQDELNEQTQQGGYPYKHKLSRTIYEKQKHDLQIELL